MSGRLRPIAAVLVGVVAVVALLVSVLSLWARSVLFDSTKVGAAVESALADPAVTGSLATRITDAAFEAGDVEERLTELVPENLGALVPALVGGARNTVERSVADALATDGARQVVVTIVEGSHARLMRVLAGDGVVDGVTVQDGEVQLNLLPLVGIALDQVQQLGYLDQVTIPELAPSGDPSTQIAALETAFGRDLGDQFGQLTVYRSDALADAGQTVSVARDALELAKRALVIVVLLTVAAFAGCVALARRRGRAVLALALASVAVMVIARVIVRKVLDEAPAVVLDPGGQAAIRATLESLTSGLFTLLGLVIVLGAAVSVVAFVRSDQRLAVGLRSRAGSMGPGSMGLRSAIEANRDVTAFVAFALAVAVIAIGGLGLGSFVVALVFAAIGAWAMWVPAPGGPSAPAD